MENPAKTLKPSSRENAKKAREARMQKLKEAKEQILIEPAPQPKKKTMKHEEIIYDDNIDDYEDAEMDAPGYVLKPSSREIDKRVKIKKAKKTIKGTSKLVEQLKDIYAKQKQAAEKLAEPTPPPAPVVPDVQVPTKSAAPAPRPPPTKTATAPAKSTPKPQGITNINKNRAVNISAATNKLLHGW